MSRSKDKGTAWETETVRVLRDHGAPGAERRALHGNADRGDIAGVVGVVIEDKAEAHQDLAGWTRELLAEMANDGADIGLVWAKRVGKTSALDGYMILPPIVGLRLLARAGSLAPETDWKPAETVEPPAPAQLDLDAVKAEFLALCGSCDAGLPMACACSPRDFRGTMSDLVAEVEALREALAGRP